MTRTASRPVATPGPRAAADVRSVGCRRQASCDEPAGDELAGDDRARSPVTGSAISGASGVIVTCPALATVCSVLRRCGLSWRRSGPAARRARALAYASRRRNFSRGGLIGGASPSAWILVRARARSASSEIVQRRSHGRDARAAIATYGARHDETNSGPITTARQLACRSARRQAVNTTQAASASRSSSDGRPFFASSGASRRHSTP